MAEPGSLLSDHHLLPADAHETRDELGAMCADTVSPGEVVPLRPMCEPEPRDQKLRLQASQVAIVGWMSFLWLMAS